MRLDFMKGLQAPFADENWMMKLLIGSILVLASPLIIPSFILMGYMVSVMRDSANGGGDKLPEFDWVNQGMSGLMVSGALFLLNLIPTAIISVGVASMVTAILSAGLFDPKVWLAAIMGAGAMTLGCVSLGFFIIFVISFFVPALLMRFAITGQFMSLFGFGQAVRDIMASPLDYIVAFVLVNAIGIGYSMLCSATFGIAALLMPVYVVVSGLIYSRLMGDYYRLCLN